MKTNIYDKIKGSVIQTIEGNRDSTQKTARALTARDDIQIIADDGTPRTDSKTKIFIPKDCLKGQELDPELLQGIIHESGHISKKSNRRYIDRPQEYGLTEKNTQELNNIIEDIYIDGKLSTEVLGYKRLMSLGYKKHLKKHRKKYQETPPQKATVRTTGLQLLQRNCEKIIGEKLPDILPEASPAKLGKDELNKLVDSFRKYDKSKKSRAKKIGKLQKLLEKQKKNTEEKDRDGKPEERDRDGKPEERDRDGKPEEKDRDGKPEEKDRDSKPEEKDRDSKPEERPDRDPDHDEATAPDIGRENIQTIIEKKSKIYEDGYPTPEQLKEITKRALEKLIYKTNTKKVKGQTEIDEDKLINILTGKPQDIFKTTQQHEAKTVLYIISDKSISMKTRLNKSDNGFNANSIIDKFLMDLRDIYKKMESQLEIKVIFYSDGIHRCNGKEVNLIEDIIEPVDSNGCSTKPLPAVIKAVKENRDEKKAVLFFTDGVIWPHQKHAMKEEVTNTPARVIRLLPDLARLPISREEEEHIRAPIISQDKEIEETIETTLNSREIEVKEKFIKTFIIKINSLIDEMRQKNLF